jgi:type VI secretion system protein ImpA
MVSAEEDLPEVSESNNTGLSLVTSDVPATAIRTRAEAYRLLEQAADFLQRTEPHSPTPYLLRRAVSWGRMSFDQLLPELVRSNSELSEIVRLLQVEVSKNPKP